MFGQPESHERCLKSETCLRRLLRCATHGRFHHDPQHYTGTTHTVAQHEGGRAGRRWGRQLAQLCCA
eukprot:2037865-Rhodomonas_salina.6